MFDWVLKTHLMMAVARYWDNICNKTIILFRVLAKRTHSACVPGSGSTYKMNNGSNERKSLHTLKMNIKN